MSNAAPVKLVAGATDFLVRHRDILDSETFLIDCTAVPEMQGVFVDESEGALCIGAAATFTEIAADSRVRTHATALAEAAASVGSVQIRNRATLGGNVANASPAADSLPALACLGAICLVTDSAGRVKHLPVLDLIAGFEKNTLTGDEFIQEFQIPIQPERITGFLKLGSREHVSISRINMAISIYLREGNASELTAWVGTLGSRPVSISVEGIVKSKEMAAAFKQRLAALVDVKIAGRYSQVYKRSAVQGLGESLFMRLTGEASGGEIR